MMVPYSCKKCKWYDNAHKHLEGEQKGYGYCRKHKPIPYMKNGRYYGTWPIVHELDLCGEFRGDE